MIFWMHYFWMRSETDESYQIFMPFNNIYISPVSSEEILPREIFFGGKLQNEALSLAAFRVIDDVV